VVSANTLQLTIDGAVERPRRYRFHELVELAGQVPDVSAHVPGRKGTAVWLSALLADCGPRPEADYLTLHAEADDFHASVPLAAVRERLLVVYRLGDEALPASAGGPFRVLIVDHDACHAGEVDECANVKFVDRIELSVGRGHDNRPTDEAQHAALHHPPQAERPPQA